MSGVVPNCRSLAMFAPILDVRIGEIYIDLIHVEQSIAVTVCGKAMRMAVRHRVAFNIQHPITNKHV